MWHWTDAHIRVHVSYCVTALAVAHLMRRETTQAGIPMSVPDLLDKLAGIGKRPCSTPPPEDDPGPTR